MKSSLIGRSLTLGASLCCVLPAAALRAQEQPPAAAAESPAPPAVEAPAPAELAPEPPGAAAARRVSARAASRRLSTAQPSAADPAEPAATSAAPPAQPVDAEEPRLPPRPPLFDAWLGVGNLWVSSRGFDAFADDDALLGFSAGAGLRLSRGEGLQARAVATWDIAGRDASYRGQDARLQVMRFGLGPELVLPLVGGLGLSGRVAAIALRSRAELDEGSTGATLSDAGWSVGAEGAVGLNFRFADLSAQHSSVVFLARAEGGYSWAPERSLALTSSDAPRRSDAVRLGELALAGPLMRVSLGVGF